MGRGDRVAIYAENRAGFVLATRALRLGAIAVPTNVLYRAADSAHPQRRTARVGVGSAASAPRTARRGALRRRGRCGSLGRDATIPVNMPTCPPPRPMRDHHLHQRHDRTRERRADHARQPRRRSRRKSAARGAGTTAIRCSITLPLFHVHGLGAASTDRSPPARTLLLRERFDAREAARRCARARSRCSSACRRCTCGFSSTSRRSEFRARPAVRFGFRRVAGRRASRVRGKVRRLDPRALRLDRVRLSRSATATTAARRRQRRRADAGRRGHDRRAEDDRSASRRATSANCWCRAPTCARATGNVPKRRPKRSSSKRRNALVSARAISMRFDPHDGVYVVWGG